MENAYRKAFLENKNRLSEIVKLGKQREAEVDPEKKAALEKELLEKGDALKVSLGIVGASEDGE